MYLDNESTDNFSNNVHRSIPYISHETAHSFTRKGDINSFGGIMYEIANGERPFYDKARNTCLTIDICYGVRPKIMDIMINWDSRFYSDVEVMKRQSEISDGNKK